MALLSTQTENVIMFILSWYRCHRHARTHTHTCLCFCFNKQRRQTKNRYQTISRHNACPL